MITKITTDPEDLSSINSCTLFLMMSFFSHWIF